MKLGPWRVKCEVGPYGYVHAVAEWGCTWLTTRVKLHQKVPGAVSCSQCNAVPNFQEYLVKIFLENLGNLSKSRMAHSFERTNWNLAYKDIDGLDFFSGESAIFTSYRPVLRITFRLGFKLAPENLNKSYVHDDVSIGWNWASICSPIYETSLPIQLTFMMQGDAGLEALQPQMVPGQLTWQLIGIDIKCEFVHTHHCCKGNTSRSPRTQKSTTWTLCGELGECQCRQINQYVWF